MNRKIIKYNLIDSYTALAIVNKVNSEITNGWQPYRECTYSDGKYVQTMVKYEVINTQGRGPG